MDPKQAAVPSIYLRNLVELFESWGVAGVQVLDGTGIKISCLNDPKARFTYAQQRRVFENAFELSPVEGLGLYTGSKLSPHDHGVYGYAMMTSGTLYQALLVLTRFYPLAGVPFEVSLEETRKEYRIVVTDLEPARTIHQTFIEDFFTSTNCSLFTLTERRFRAKALHLDYPKPAFARRYTDIFQCPVLFSQRRCYLVMSRAQGDLPISTSDPETAKICAQRCELILQRMQTAKDFVEQVRSILLRLPCTHRDAEHAASQLSMSSRHLRRKLKEEDTSFQVVLDNVRLELAKDFLGQTRLPLEEVAPLLGYSELTNFRRAFKKWTGQTPSAFRQSQLAQ